MNQVESSNFIRCRVKIKDISLNLIMEVLRVSRILESHGPKSLKHVTGNIKMMSGFEMFRMAPEKAAKLNNITLCRDRLTI